MASELSRDLAHPAAERDEAKIAEWRTGEREQEPDVLYVCVQSIGATAGRTESAICELAMSQGHLTLVTLSNLGAVLGDCCVVLSLLPRMLTGGGLSAGLAGAAFGAGRCGPGRTESEPLVKGPA